MIHYALRCTSGHEFDGWFKDSAAFEVQAERRLVTCPECGDAQVARGLMAPAIARPSAPPAAPADPAPPAGAPPTALAHNLPDEMRAVLQRIRAEVERTSDYVGPDFAEEARRIHYGESEKRNIYGESTREEAEALAEDGVAFTRIPWVPRADG